jgi:hypothetical protein
MRVNSRLLIFATFPPNLAAPSLRSLTFEPRAGFRRTSAPFPNGFPRDWKGGEGVSVYGAGRRSFRLLDLDVPGWQFALWGPPMVVRRASGRAADRFGCRKPTAALNPKAPPCLAVHPWLVVDTTKGNRPSFTEAASQELAEALYKAFCEALRELGVPVQTGVFRARMSMELVNEGPVTIVLEL